MKDGTELIAEHYQKTFELTLKLWDARNMTFLLLLFVVGLGTLITFKVDQAEPLLVDLIAGLLNIEDAGRIGELRTSFPYGLIQSILLMIVLYLTVQLYHRTINITRNYSYLAHLEEEIREGIGIQQHQLSFTREGSFYWQNSSEFSKLVGVTYILMLGLLLIAFFGMRILVDLLAADIFVIIVDVLLAVPTLIFFGKYAYSSSSIIRNLLSKNK